MENGPYWDELAQFAADPMFYSASDKTSLICGPLLAEVTDADVFEQARQRIESGDDSGSWFFTAGETPVSFLRSSATPRGPDRGWKLAC